MLNSVPNSEDMLERFLHKKRDIVPIIRIFSNEILIGPPF